MVLNWVFYSKLQPASERSGHVDPKIPHHRILLCLCQLPHVSIFSSLPSWENKGTGTMVPVTTINGDMLPIMNQTADLMYAFDRQWLYWACKITKITMMVRLGFGYIFIYPITEYIPTYINKPTNITSHWIIHFW